MRKTGVCDVCGVQKEIVGRDMCRPCHKAWLRAREDGATLPPPQEKILERLIPTRMRALNAITASVVELGEWIGSSHSQTIKGVVQHYELILVQALDPGVKIEKIDPEEEAEEADRAGTGEIPERELTVDSSESPVNSGSDPREILETTEDDVATREAYQNASGAVPEAEGDISGTSDADEDVDDRF